MTFIVYSTSTLLKIVHAAFTFLSFLPDIIHNILHYYVNFRIVDYAISISHRL